MVRERRRKEEVVQNKERAFVERKAGMRGAAPVPMHEKRRIAAAGAGDAMRECEGGKEG